MSTQHEQHLYNIVKYYTVQLLQVADSKWQ
jgi:hypothetical protein